MTVVHVHKQKHEAAEKFKRRATVRRTQAAILHIAVCSSFGFNANSLGICCWVFRGRCRLDGHRPPVVGVWPLG